MDSSSIVATALADNAQKYLEQKPALLSNPGTRLDDVYYSALTSRVENSEVTYSFGRLNVAIPGLTFGSASQASIPNSSLLAGCYLHLELDLQNQPGVSLPRGWGYAAISQINYQMGSSNANQQALTGQSLWQVISGQCETEEKRSMMWQLGGQETFSTTTQGLVGRISADILLPLPWSGACGLYEKLPIDTAMLNSQIFVTVGFNLADQWIGGGGVKPIAFSQAQLLCRLGDFTNKDQSLGPIIKRDAQLIYGYPFIHHQNFSVSNITSADIDVPLTSILNADLVGLSFGVVKASDLQSTITTTPNPFNYQAVTDIQLLFNGQPVAVYPGQMYYLQSMHSSIGDSSWNNSIVQPGNGLGVNVFTSSPVQSFGVYIDFSRKRQACYTGEYANVWRIGANTLQLRCHVASGVNTAYRMFVTYYYNGIADLQNGESRLYY
jgi:hypothetical protein